MMRIRALLLPATAVLSLMACDQAEVSTREMGRLAIDRARQELGLGADVPLQATVWTGKPYEDKITMCGTVSAAEGSSTPVEPQRFAANGDPPQFLFFEPAHEEMVQSRPGMFQSFETLCAGTQAG